MRYSWGLNVNFFNLSTKTPLAESTGLHVFCSKDCLPGDALGFLDMLWGERCVLQFIS